MNFEYTIFMLPSGRYLVEAGGGGGGGGLGLGGIHYTRADNNGVIIVSSP